MKDKLYTETVIADIEDITIQILSDYGIENFSLKVISGTAEIIGTRSLGSRVSNATSLLEGEYFSFSKQSGVATFSIIVKSGSTVQITAL
jgi:hypothetical protein